MDQITHAKRFQTVHIFLLMLFKATSWHINKENVKGKQIKCFTYTGQKNVPAFTAWLTVVTQI